MFNAGVRGRRAKDSTGLLTVGEHFNQQQYLIPTVTRFAVTDGSFVDTNDTAADTAGGQTIVVYGSGFAPGATVLVGSTTIGAVTFLDSGRLTFSSPALGSGSYTIFVTNANGGTGILVPGLVYSGVPTFTTSAGSLGTVYETTAISTSVVATGDAPITYALSSGSLPSGSTLSSGGTISGTAPVDGSSTTYSFTVQATDAQNQDSVRSFSLTINTDVVSFSSPANNTTTTATQNTAISNVTVVATSAAGYGVLYTSSGLPTGLSMNTSTGIISGTPTVVASNTSIITATANTTTRTAALYLNWTINLPGDLFWKYASLLMSANTVPNGNTFNTDASTINNEIVVVADTKPSKFHPFKEGYYSMNFDGTGQLFYNSSFTGANFGASNNFTIEMWVLWSTATAAGNQTIFELTGTTRLIIGRSSTGIRVYNNTTEKGYTVTVPSTWNHIAVVRNSGTINIYLNGVSGTSYADTTNWTHTQFYTSKNSDGAELSEAQRLSNLRIVNGTAIYTSNFTPPTAPLTAVTNTTLLMCASSMLAVDKGPNNFPITVLGVPQVNTVSPFNGTPTTVTVPGVNNYSMYFDGTGDYLSIPTNSAFNIATNSFTVEAWINTSSATQQSIFNISDTGSSGYGAIRVQVLSNQTVQWLMGPGGSWGVAVTAGSITLGTWNHIAITRNGSSVYFFINGSQVGSTQTYGTSLTTGGTTYIGYNSGTAFGFNGYISNLRFINGNALYTANTTPSTSPLTTLANTSLLTCQANTVIDNSNNVFTITTAGNARPARNGPFANTTTVTLVGNEGSAYFDGTGDLLTIPNHPSHAALGTSDFTLELWFNQTVLNARDNYLISHRVSGYAPFLFWINSSGSLRSYASTSLGSWDTMNDTALATISLNTWYHLAYTRSGSTFKIFLNGAQVYTFASSATFTTATTPLNIGGQAGGTDNFTGYVSNARFVKGTALYTTPFVPSWAPLTPVANTVLLTAQTNLSSNTKVVVDESNFNNIVTGNGNATLGSFSPFGSSWSGYFDGTGDYLQTPSSKFSLGTIFTVEAWVYPTTSPTNAIVFASTSSGEFSLGYYSNTGFGVSGRGVTWLLYSATMPVVGAWNHIAVVRAGLGTNQTSIYINGTRVVNGTISSAFTTAGTWQVGYDGGGGGTSWTGYISNLRVVAGTDLYGYTNTTITPSTTPLVSVANTVLLTCNSNQLVDYSAANNVITRNGDASVSKFSPFSSVTVTPASYSGFFDGSGDYLSVPYNVALNLSTGAPNFTVEAWFNIPALIGSSQCIISKDWQAGSTNASYALALQQNGQFFYFFGNGTNASYSQQYSYTIPGGGLGAWNHVAMVRNSSNMLCFFNGALVQTIAITGTMVDAGNPVFIGMTQNSSEVLTNGYVSNARIVKGTAVYTATFTPPTAPLTAIANTSLLTCQSTTFIDNSANAFTITVAGNTKPVIQNPFTDTVSTASNYSANTFSNSVYFDGSGDWLNISYNNSLTLLSGDYTIECWVYPLAFNTYNYIIMQDDGTNGSQNFQLSYNNSGQLQYTLWTSSSRASFFAITSSSNLTLRAWNHIAVTYVLSSTTTRMFINGTSVGSSTTATWNGSGYTGQTTIGNWTSSSTNQTNVYGTLNCYISNLRMVKGTALYTGPFIPSNQPLPPTSNTTLLLASTSGPSVTDALRISNMETTGTARYVANNSPYYDTYSGYFDGTGDYLTFGANQANLGLGTGDFTFEFWFNAATIPSTEVDFFESQTTGSFRILKRASSSGLSYDWYGGTAYLIKSDATITTNEWHHVAVSRTSGTISAYYDGTRVINQADSTSGVTPTANYGVGGRASGANYLNGYISNMRLIKGTGLYSGTTITVPTGPLTAVTNTQLLICNTNRFIDGSTNAFTITKAGDAKISTLQPFAANNTSRFSSVYFPAKTDYLAVRPQPSLITFPGDFTFECWVYPTDTSLSTSWGIWDARQSGATGVAMTFSLAPLASPVTGSWRLSYFNGTQYYGTGTVLWNQWTHVTWVRSGTTMTFYVNGVAGGTATISGIQTATATSNPIYIGAKDNGSAGYGTVGYIADFRITNGYARTITVPTAPYDIK